ncbi:hypothetical protein BD410DRAFT_847229 [Rickenella mellea]|uniref:Uncharacterized protein n=1 Tax=Rickenella mellea TaxID=50990 RepID=A0A4Y7PDB8_9AGAM|nr:hypothetical protein BD410DRAFT_847229 [Rickenella mellea]
MPFISVPVILDATVYNGFLVDHDATAQSQIQGIKENHVFALARVLVAHHLENDLEIHLLHRHFILGDGEAMVHWEISCPNPDITNGNPPSVSIDVAKVMRCPEVAGEEFHPVMWFSADKDTLIPYEYAFTAKSSCQRRVVNRASTEKLSAFAKDFSAIVWQAGLENLISLKDKSCLAGAEYVAPDIRALFRVPFSIITIPSIYGRIVLTPRI